LLLTSWQQKIQAGRLLYVHPAANHKKQAMLKFEQAFLEAEERAFPEAGNAVN